MATEYFWEKAYEVYKVHHKHSSVHIVLKIKITKTKKPTFNEKLFNFHVVK